MTLPTQTLQNMIDNMIASWASQVGVTPSLSEGDFLLAVFEATALQLDFLQTQALTIVLLTRAQTSTGSDLDTWMAQFDFFRLPATFASGPETFSKLTPAVTAVTVSPGATVQTVGGGIQYTVIADTTQSAWNPSLNLYVLSPGSTSMNVTVQANVAGSGSNVSAGQLNQLSSSVPGIDNVTNPSVILNGFNAESDAAFRARFALYLSSLAKATKAAIQSAALSVQQGITAVPLENQTPTGATLMGSFSVIVDNGTGSPSSTLLNSVFAAVDAVRAFSVQPFVSGPTLVVVTVSLTIRVASGYVSSSVTAAVKAAISAAGPSVGVGNTLYVSFVEGVALAVPGVVSVRPGTTLNGTAADITVLDYQEVSIPLSDISVGTY